MGGAVRRLPLTVVVLGVVSFFTDLSSEMIYPLLPVFLTAVLGAGPEALGLVEGVAEATAALFKVVSGVWSDRVRKRKPLVVVGYGLAGLVRPLVGLATTWSAVLAIRFTDRVGKGLRNSPRDALIADVTPPQRRGEAFGFQRALDHAGAVTGPLIAAALLSAAGLAMRTVFLLAFVPAVLVMIVLVAGVREVPSDGRPVEDGDRARGRESLGRPFHVFLVALVLFALGNSTDAFILLRLTDAGVPAAAVAVLWSVFHVVKMITTYAGGRLSDRWGRRAMVTAGWAFYAAVYLAFGMVDSRPLLIATFLAYGVYFGLTEPVERAWVVDLAPRDRRATAFGLYHAAIGVAALPASLLFGLLWQHLGARTAFFTGAGLACAATLVLLLVPRHAGEQSQS